MDSRVHLATTFLIKHLFKENGIRQSVYLILSIKERFKKKDCIFKIRRELITSKCQNRADKRQKHRNFCRFSLINSLLLFVFRLHQQQNKQLTAHHTLSILVEIACTDQRLYGNEPQMHTLVVGLTGSAILQ